MDKNNLKYLDDGTVDFVPNKGTSKMKNNKNMYSLDCEYFDKEFSNIDQLIDYCVENGMDPNYEVTLDGKGIGEELMEFIVG